MLENSSILFKLSNITTSFVRWHEHFVQNYEQQVKDIKMCWYTKILFLILNQIFVSFFYEIVLIITFKPAEEFDKKKL